MSAPCPPGDTSLGCFLGIPLPGTPPTVLKAEVAIPAAAAGQHGASLTATVTIAAALGLPGARVTVGATAARPAPSSSSPRPAAAAATGAPAAGQVTAPQAGAAWPAGPGAPASAVSAVGAPLPALGALSPVAGARGLTFPTVTPGQGQAPSSAVPRSADGSMSAVSDRLPLSSGQLQLQADGLGLLAIALVITIARVWVPARIPQPLRAPGRLVRRLPGHRGDQNAGQDAAPETAAPASAGPAAP